MAIQYQESGRIFTLHTNHPIHQMKADSYENLLHLYHGDRAEDFMEYTLIFEDGRFLPNPYEAGDDRTYSLNALPQEYPHQGSGDFRSPAFAMEQAGRSHGLSLRYAGYGICKGKYSFPGLPAMCGEGREGAESLKIRLIDQVSGLAVTLLYGVFPGYDIITKAVCVGNGGDGPVALKRVHSACLDFLHGEHDLIQLYGRHTMKRSFQRTALCHGAQVIGSRRGISNHQYNPFLILAGRETTEVSGPRYSMSSVCSGPFKVGAETDQYGQTRMVIGLQDEMFSYEFKPGERFFGPEVIMGYSGQGLGALSRSIHKAIRRSLCRGGYKIIPRPMLINNWEATYFDFTGEKILDIARQAEDLGVEMMVLDDGWFGNRDLDFSGLGGWQVNVKKLGGSLGNLVSRINSLGMEFDTWVEPEMVSEDSCLYREHPDWAFVMPRRKPVWGRSQLVPGFSRKEATDYTFDSTCQVLDSAHIEYLKWDMDHSTADVYSAVDKTAGGDSLGSVLYRYMLGLYDFLKRLTKRYPDLLIEGCNGRGGCFDVGMLYYTPRIRCNGNTDAADRIRTQYSASFGYPISAVGSHVSVVPSHQTGRITPMKTRGVVATMSSSGYELNLNAMPDEKKNCVREQIDTYHKYWHLIHDEECYRLASPFEDRETATRLFVREDRGEALLNAVTLKAHGNPLTLYVRLEGLEPGAMYRDEDTGAVYLGTGLTLAGIPTPPITGEYQAWQVHLRRT